MLGNARTLRLSLAMCVACGLASSQQSPDDHMAVQVSVKKDSEQECTAGNPWYKPSPAEQKFKIVGGEGFCDDDKNDEMMSKWLDGQATNKGRPNGDLSNADDKRDPEVFSEICDKHGVHGYIEPLIANLQDPRVACGKGDDWAQSAMWDADPGITTLSKAFIALPQMKPDEKSEKIKGKVLIFDVGASCYAACCEKDCNPQQSGWGSSGMWLNEEFQAAGLKADHFYAFEKNTDEAKYRETVPEELNNSLTYFHVAISGGDGTGPENPLDTLVQNCHKDDYCIIKVDFDYDEGEKSVINKLAENAPEAPANENADQAAEQKEEQGDQPSTNSSDLLRKKKDSGDQAADSATNVSDLFRKMKAAKRSKGKKQHQFVQAILDNAQATELVDELFWEPLSDGKESTYNLHVKLRNAGIRTHSWV